LKKGKLYLLPTILSENSKDSSIPIIVNTHIDKINIFFVENIRTSRRYIKNISYNKDIDNILFYSFGKHDSIDMNKDFLPHILKGKDIGLLSEAGLPCIADPGSKIVEYAHNMQVDVIPLVGPSSIFLSLMASGMNGQNFTFNGYLPINNKERIRALRNIEILSKKYNTTQIFIETPYRNNKLLNTILKTCNKKTRLCIASNISSPLEYIKTKNISEWKEEKINLHKIPTIFLIG
tara:strand:+ start:261 stop:965 length:705 start_codon:yes stop_codon:yes gene_type:complete